MTPLDELAAFLAGLRTAALPAEVHEAAGHHALDALACSLAATGSDLHRALAAVPTGEPGGLAEVGAALAHRLEFDDIHDETLLCIGGLVVPTAVAVGLGRGASGADALAAIVAGYEAAGRLGRALRSAELLRRGWWPSAVCGAFGAAAAAARLRGLGPGPFASALALAAQHSGGIVGGDDGAPGRLLVYGGAARAGIVAADAAAAGLVGAHAIVAGRRGLGEAYGIETDEAALRESLGERWVVAETAVKAWACARQLHAAVEAALALRGALALDAITEVVVEVPAAVSFVDRPAPSTAGLAGSAQWVIAVALARGAVGPADLAPEGALADPQVARLATLVRVVASDAPGRSPLGCTLAIRARGITHTRAVPIPRGGPSRPLRDGEVRAKAAGLVTPVLGAAAAGFLEAATTIDRQPSVAALAAWSERMATPYVAREGGHDRH